VDDQLAVIKLVTRRLDAAGVDYMVTGSIASGHYGQPRMTRDTDIVAVQYPVDIDGQPVWLIAPEDLVLSKLVWSKDSRSELQLRDIRSIIALQPGLDWAYMNRWAGRLTVASALSELRP
jgi:hypothetical protein